ncbi:MAG: M56 family metallopeptidase [Bacteroidetes bacterium]|nr:M56 family metallopeptidase [Bacteroidota bacterium]
MVSAFEQSPFLLALGKALLYNLGEGLLLFALFLFIKNGISPKNANAKYKLALGTYFCLFLLLVGNFLYFFSTNSVNHAPQINLNASVASSTTLRTHKPFHFESLFSIISIIYLIAVTFLLSRLVIYYKNVRLLFNSTLKIAPAHFEKFIEKIGIENGISQKVQIWICDHIDVPATIGYFKPVIFLPFSVISQLSLPQIEAILLHEFAHIKRNDYLINLMLAFCSTLLFFNPFHFVLLKIIKEERENCCDDFVINYQYDCLTYSDALFKIEKERIQKLELVLAAVSEKNELLKRVKRINGFPDNRGQYPKLSTILFFVLLSAGLAFLILKFESNRSIAKIPKEIRHSQSEESITVKTVSMDSITKKTIPVQQSSHSNALVKNNTGKILIKIIAPAAQPVPQASPRLPEFNTTVIDLKDNQFTSIDLNEINAKIKAATAEIDKVNWQDVGNQINKTIQQANEKFSKINQENSKRVAQLIAQRQAINFQNLQKNIKLLIRDSMQIAQAILLQQQYSHITNNASKLVNEILRDTTRLFTLPRIKTTLLP